MHLFSLSIGILSSWFTVNASVAAPARDREEYVKLAPRSPQPTLNVERFERNCNEDSDCPASGTCTEPSCFNGWCSLIVRYDTPLSKTGPSCYLGQYIEASGLPAECGAQNLEQMAQAHAHLNEFNKISCGDRTPEQCEYHRHNELRQSLIRAARDILRCITDYETGHGSSEPIPWDQTPYRGVIVEGGERDPR